MLWGCGVSNLGSDETSETTVDVRGAALSQSQFLLTVPPGALRASQKVTVVTTSHDDETRDVRVTPLFDVRPNGLDLDVPAFIDVEIDDPSIDPSEMALFWSPASGHQYQELETSVDGRKLSASVSRLGRTYGGYRHRTDGGISYDGGHYDGGYSDGGHYDGGSYDGGHYDGGYSDGGTLDGGSYDGGN